MVPQKSNGTVVFSSNLLGEALLFETISFAELTPNLTAAMS